MTEVVCREKIDRCVLARIVSLPPSDCCVAETAGLMDGDFRVTGYRVNGRNGDAYPGVVSRVLESCENVRVVMVCEAVCDLQRAECVFDRGNETNFLNYVLAQKWRREEGVWILMGGQLYVRRRPELDYGLSICENMGMGEVVVVVMSNMDFEVGGQRAVWVCD